MLYLLGAQVGQYYRRNVQHDFCPSLCSIVVINQFNSDNGKFEQATIFSLRAPSKPRKYFPYKYNWPGSCLVINNDRSLDMGRIQTKNNGCAFTISRQCGSMITLITTQSGDYHCYIQFMISNEKKDLSQLPYLGQGHFKLT